jgi:hypothetical protein
MTRVKRKKVRYCVAPWRVTACNLLKLFRSEDGLSRLRRKSSSSYGLPARTQTKRAGVPARAFGRWTVRGFCHRIRKSLLRPGKHRRRVQLRLGRPAIMFTYFPPSPTARQTSRPQSAFYRRLPTPAPKSSSVRILRARIPLTHSSARSRTSYRVWRHILPISRVARKLLLITKRDLCLVRRRQFRL